MKRAHLNVSDIIDAQIPDSEGRKLSFAFHQDDRSALFLRRQSDCMKRTLAPGKP